MPKVGIPFRQSMAPPANDVRPDSTVQDLERQLTDAKMARAQLEPTWFLNLAYYAGDQWVFWDGGKLVKPKLRKDRVLLVDNRIQPAVRRSLAKRTKTRPTFELTPTTPLEDDVYAALMGELQLQDVWHRLFLTKRLRTALKWADIAGAGFWKVFWDSGVGAKGEALLGPDGQPLTNEYGRPVKGEQFDAILEQVSQVDPKQAEEMDAKVTRKPIFEGEVGVDVRSPFQLAPDPLCEQFDECEFLFEEIVKSPEYVKTRWDQEIKPDAQAVVGLLEGRMSSLQAGGATSNYKGVRVKEFWARPCSKYPRGKYVVWAGNRLLEENDNPYERLPYVMFTGVEVPGRLWPTSISEQMRGPQTELNKVKSQIAENRNRIGNPTVLLSRMANVKMVGIPGEKVYYDDTTQNAIPKYLQPPEMPAYIQNEIASIETALMETSGQHEVSSAQVPAGVTAAAAIQLLQEADDTMLGPVIEDQETQLSHAGEMILELIADKYTTNRKLRIAGPDGAWDVMDFNGAMLRGNTRVRVRTGSSMPQSKAARQAEMTQMLTLFVQNGVALSERNLRKFFQEYDAGALERLFGDLSADERQIHREHQRIRAGETIEPDPLVDNSDAHIAGHQEFMKTPMYSQWDEGAQARLRQHLNLTVVRAQAKAAEAAQQAAATGNPEAAQANANLPEPDPMATGPMTLPIFPPRMYDFSGAHRGFSPSH